MILSDGTDTREETARPGRFCDGMAAVLLALAQEGMEDDVAGDFTVTGNASRFGRRILWASTSGFLMSETFATVAQAEQIMEEAHATMDVFDWDGEK